MKPDLELTTLFNNKKFEKMVKTYMEAEVIEIKQLRQDIDKIIQRVCFLQRCRETSLVITKLEEAVMWLGMDLKRLNQPNPYPSSKDPSTGTKIDSTADNLTFSNIQ